MHAKIKFRLVPQDEFDARYPEVNEHDAPGVRFPGEVQVPGVPGWLPASIHRGLPDRYWLNDEWCLIEPKTEFVKVK